MIVSGRFYTEQEGVSDPVFNGVFLELKEVFKFDDKIKILPSRSSARDFYDSILLVNDVHELSDVGETVSSITTANVYRKENGEYSKIKCLEHAEDGLLFNNYLARERDKRSIVSLLLSLTPFTVFVNNYSLEQDFVISEVIRGKNV